MHHTSLMFKESRESLSSMTMMNKLLKSIYSGFRDDFDEDDEIDEADRNDLDKISNRDTNIQMKSTKTTSTVEFNKRVLENMRNPELPVGLNNNS